ncbi:putative lymphocyte cytosolic protein 2 [Trypoxylus dichotomus]
MRKAIKENPEKFVNCRINITIRHSTGSAHDDCAVTVVTDTSTVPVTATSNVATTATITDKALDETGNQKLKSILNRNGTLNRKKSICRVNFSEELQVIDIEDNNDEDIYENLLPTTAISPMLIPVRHKSNIPQKREGSPTVFQQVPAVPKAVEESRYCINIDRQKAEWLLQDVAKDGAYLFRPSSKHQYALSVLYENKVLHIGVKLIENNRLEFVTIKEKRQFNSLEDIVEYFEKRPELHMSEDLIIQLTQVAMAN